MRTLRKEDGVGADTKEDVLPFQEGVGEEC